MGEEVIIIPIVFGVIFGIFYLFIAARNKERLALIEKGADASIFYGKKRVTAMWKVIVINLALLLIGIGVGIFIAAILHQTMGVDDEVAYPGTIFLMSGVGLFSGFYLTKKLNHDA
jgi:flagellar biosynthesis protein FliQ